MRPIGPHMPLDYKRKLNCFLYDFIVYGFVFFRLKEVIAYLWFAQHSPCPFWLKLFLASSTRLQVG